MLQVVVIARLRGYDNFATGFDLAFLGYCHRAILIHDIRVALLGAVAKAARLLDIVFVAILIHDIRVALLGAVAKAARLLDIVFVVLSILKSDCVRGIHIATDTHGMIEARDNQSISVH